MCGTLTHTLNAALHHFLVATQQISVYKGAIEILEALFQWL
jgi:hypothetical protein